MILDDTSIGKFVQIFRIGHITDITRQSLTFVKFSEKIVPISFQKNAKYSITPITLYTSDIYSPSIHIVHKLLATRIAAIVEIS